MICPAYKHCESGFCASYMQDKSTDDMFRLSSDNAINLLNSIEFLREFCNSIETFFIDQNRQNLTNHDQLIFYIQPTKARSIPTLPKCVQFIHLWRKKKYFKLIINVTWTWFLIPSPTIFDFNLEEVQTAVVLESILWVLAFDIHVKNTIKWIYAHTHTDTQCVAHYLQNGREKRPGTKTYHQHR